MNCVSCGKSIPGGARYCIHCGVEQAVPTPIAAVAAVGGFARVARREAANAAHAEPVRPFSEPPIATEALHHPTMNRDHPDWQTTATQPAYASGPDRRGLAIALVVAAVVVAAIALVVLLWRGAPRPTEPAPDVAPAARGEAPVPPAPPAPAPEARAPVPAEVETVAPATPSSAAAQPASESPVSVGPPVQIEPLPPRPAPHAARRPASKEATERPAEAAARPAPSATSAPPVEPRAAATPPAPATRIDRWQRMEEDMSHCTREDFISRVICGQRVRFRYCDGYWGKVPQCPASPAPERGQ